MAIDPNHTTTTTTTTTGPTSRPVSPVPPPHLFTAQLPPPPPPAAHPGILYPVASSGRGFIPKPIRPVPTTTADHTVTVANPGGGAYNPSRPPLISFPPHPHSAALHLMRPNTHNLPPSPLLPHLKGLPLSATPEVAPLSSVPDCNGNKDNRDKSRDDTSAVVRDRKVRITDGASLYVLCRSWLRNGVPEENQPQYGDAVRSLPKPSPIPMASATLPKKEEGEEEDDDEDEDEDEESIEHSSPQDLLKRHVKRARKVRARLREERLRRIARYKSRLALLLPPLVEQFRNDLAAGN